MPVVVFMGVIFDVLKKRAAIETPNSPFNDF